jgi:hypothetical protein
LIADAEDAKPHAGKLTLTFCEQNSLKITLNPFYSPDLISSDFLFGNIKRLLARESFASLDELLEAFLGISKPLPHAILIRTFRERMSQVSKSILANDHHIDQITRNILSPYRFKRNVSRDNDLVRDPIEDILVTNQESDYSVKNAIVANVSNFEEYKSFFESG